MLTSTPPFGPEDRRLIAAGWFVVGVTHTAYTYWHLTVAAQLYLQGRYVD